MNKGRKLGQTSVQILSTLLRTGVMAADDFFSGKMGEDYSQKLMRGMAKSLYNLHRSGYVTLRKKPTNNQSFFHLTPKGKLKILKYLALERLKILKWDKQWRIIIFDIPETLQKWRRYLRRELKYLGFYPIQKSVYITPYPVLGSLDELLKEWNLRKYFRYITVSEIDGENELKEIFGLK